MMYDEMNYINDLLEKIDLLEKEIKRLNETLDHHVNKRPSNYIKSTDLTAVGKLTKKLRKIT